MGEAITCIGRQSHYQIITDTPHGESELLHMQASGTYNAASLWMKRPSPQATL